MLAVLKAVGVMSCSFLLCLGLANVALSADTMSDMEASKTIKGKLLRIEGGELFRQEQGGRERNTLTCRQNHHKKRRRVR